MSVQAIVLVFYMVGMLALGFYNYRKNKNLSDYFLGGRNLGPWQSAMSAQASDMSGWLLLGLPGLAFALYMGTTEAIWTALGLAIGTYLNWLLVAKRLRKHTQIAGNAITLPVYFENRFRDTTKLLRSISAIFILVFFLVYTSAQFVAAAKLFATLFTANYTTGLFIGCFTIVGYTFLGGFSAVCTMDTIQGIFLFLAMLLVPITILNSMGGIGEVTTTLAGVTTEVFSWFPKTPEGGISLILLVSAFGWGFGYFGQPHILARFMAVKSSKEIKPARIIAMVWVITTLATAVIIGVLGSAYLSGGFMSPEATASVTVDNEKIFLALVQNLMGPVIGGLLMAAVLAAISSTADSQLLVTASSVTEDLFMAFNKKQISDKALVLVSRGTVIVVSLIAVLLALNPESSVFRLVAFAWGGFGAAFGPCILFSLYWKRMTLWGAFAGILSGGVVSIVWHNLKGGIFEVYEIVPAFIISCLAIIIVSMKTKVSQEIQEEFDRAQVADI
ncbi:MAG: sodium/proline symporter PutP [Holophagaceae bacterium]|nr:sodium/proline symporter PutP [Holophagaceae bacterium]